MPVIPWPAGVSANQYLRQKATEYARQLYGEIAPTIDECLDHELEIIARMGFEDPRHLAATAERQLAAKSDVSV